MEIDEIMTIMERISDRSVEKAIARMQQIGAIPPQKTPEERVVDLLRKYEWFRHSDQEFTKKEVIRIEKALDAIRTDPYYEVIPLFYFKGLSRKMIARRMKISVKTVQRSKDRLTEVLANILCSDDVISEIYR